MTGCDLIPPRLVQQSAEVLSQQFSTLFNYVLDHTTAPSQWKLGEISPVHEGLQPNEIQLGLGGLC